MKSFSTFIHAKNRSAKETEGRDSRAEQHCRTEGRPLTSGVFRPATGKSPTETSLEWPKQEVTHSNGTLLRIRMLIVDKVLNLTQLFIKLTNRM